MGHGARSGLTRACRSSWEWRLEPFSRCTIRAMVRESPLSGSSIAAPLPADGLLHRTAFSAAPRPVRRRYQATAGAVLGRRVRAESGASRKGSSPRGGDLGGTACPLLLGVAATSAVPSPLSPGSSTLSPETGRLCRWCLQLPPLPGCLAGIFPPVGHVHLGLGNGGLRLW